MMHSSEIQKLKTQAATLSVASNAVLIVLKLVVV